MTANVSRVPNDIGIYLYVNIVHEYICWIFPYIRENIFR